MNSAFSSETSSWWQALRELFFGPKPIQTGALQEELQIRGRKIHLPAGALPVDIAMGRTGHILRILPEPAADPSVRNLLLLDPERYYDYMGGFLRLKPGASLVLGRGDEEQMRLFHYPQGINQRHLSLTHTGDLLLLNDLYSDTGTRIRPVRGAGERQRHQDIRLHRMGKVREIFGGPLRPMERPAALTLLREVNQLLQREALRPPDAQGNSGAVVMLPNTLTPVLMGDLHAQVDNLLKALVELPILEGLEREELALVILGDAIHSEQDGEMEQMESSLLMMDLILALKRRFPKRVFYLLGNHDGFSPEIRKAGVVQGAVWEHHVRFHRGEAYKDEMDRLYTRLPVMVLTPNLMACHGAPPLSRVTLEMLVNLKSYPGLMREMLWNRVQTPHRPVGYGGGDVKRLRKSLNMAGDTPLVVSHNPLAREEPLTSVWMDVANIPNHHIVFSGLPHCVGLMTRVGGHLVPMVLSSEPLLEQVNALSGP